MIHACSNCDKPAIYDEELGFAICDTCAMLGDDIMCIHINAMTVTCITQKMKSCDVVVKLNNLQKVTNKLT